jgi:hypothetical protein
MSSWAGSPALWATALLMCIIQALRLLLRARSEHAQMPVRAAHAARNVRATRAVPRAPDLPPVLLRPQTSDERALQAERTLLLSQKSQLNPVSDFVLDSKLGRQLVGLDKRLAALAAARAAPPRESAAAAALSRYGVGLCTAAVCALWWGRPLAALPAGWLSPLGWTLSLGAGARGHLGVLLLLRDVQSSVAGLYMCICICIHNYMYIYSYIYIIYIYYI